MDVMGMILHRFVPIVHCGRPSYRVIALVYAPGVCSACLPSRHPEIKERPLEPLSSQMDKSNSRTWRIYSHRPFA
ncbi:hypothetical protein RSAG8_06564, partial [Rhizoctonia solani AG-8 WAC10335]